MWGPRDPCETAPHPLNHPIQYKQTSLNHTPPFYDYPFFHSSCVNLRFSPNSIAMAGLFETLIVPRASALPSASVAPLVGSTSVRFSDFRGLKIQPTRSSVKLSSARKVRGGSRIVCEAQETAVEGASVEGLYSFRSSDFWDDDFSSDSFFFCLVISILVKSWCVCSGILFVWVFSLIWID